MTNRRELFNCRELLNAIKKQLETDFLFADLHPGAICFMADFTCGNFEILRCFYFLGDPVEDAVLMNIGETACTPTNRNKWFR